MPRLTRIRVRNFRSIGDWVSVTLPEDGALVLIGENNSGKSNLVAAIDVALGETWPGSFSPEDHHYHMRDREALPIQILLDVDDMTFVKQGRDIAQISWKYDPEDDQRPCSFDAVFGDGSTAWMSNNERDQLAGIVIGADRRLSYQLSYTSKWTLLSRLMRRFHETLVEDDERIGRLQEKFDQIVAIFGEVPEFQGFSDELRRMAHELGANLTYALEMDFSAYDPSNYYRSLRVHPTSDGEVRSFDELGTGQEQILALAFAYSFAVAYGAGGGLVMVIEEPEAHLHPLAQQWLSAKIHELSGDGLQIIVTTHSPAFVDLARIDGIVRVSKNWAGATRVVQQTASTLANHCRESGATRADEANIEAFYSASATDDARAGLFARACVVVEGPTEVLALPTLLAACGVDLVRNGIALVSAGGIGSIARWIRLYGAYGIPTFAILDADSNDDPDGTRRADLLTALGTESVWSSPSDPVTVSDRYAVLAPDFERALRRLFPKAYEAGEDDARNRLGTSKPIVARAACESLGECTDENGWLPLRELAIRISKLAVGPDDGGIRAAE